MSRVGLYFDNKTESIAEKRLKIAICKMRMSLDKVLETTMSDVSHEQRSKIDNAVFFNPKAYYEIHDDVESKSKKIPFLDDNNEMVENATKLVLPIIDKLRSGDSAASRKLDELLQNSDLRIRISPIPEIDAGCEYIPPSSPSEKGTVNLGFCSGCFADNVTEDELAVTIGHEFGHALLEQKMGGNATIPHIECFEIENFCDAYGSRLAEVAGYNIQARSDYLTKTRLRGDTVHPNWEHREQTNNIFQSNNAEYKSLDKNTVDRFNQYNKELIIQSYVTNESEKQKISR